jgi:hypothetical protein
VTSVITTTASHPKTRAPANRKRFAADVMFVLTWGMHSTQNHQSPDAQPACDAQKQAAQRAVQESLAGIWQFRPSGAVDGVEV